MIPLAASLSLFAEGSHDEQKLVGDVTRSLKLTLLLVVPAIIIFFLAGDKILLLFGTAYSENATTLLRVLAVSALPASVNYIYFSLRRVEMRMKSVVGLSASIAVVTLALSFFLLPRMGILGAGVSYLIAQVIPASGISLWLLKRHRGQEV
jgi:O-antigen/teichoic acid export membrane protein